MSSVVVANTHAPTAAAPSATRSIAWKRLWRTDAVANLLFSDALLFAAIPIQKTLDMSPDVVTPIRVLGVYFAIYGLMQLWFARQGEPARRIYQLAAFDMLLFGVGCETALIAGIDVNALGFGVIAALSAGGYIAAILWYWRSRQLR